MLCVAAAAPEAATAAAAFTVRRVAAGGASAPGGGAYVEFLGAPSLDRGQVAFRAIALDGADGRLGVFRTDAAGANALTIVDTLTPVPGGTGLFTSFGALSLDGGQVAVIGFAGEPSSGIYLGGGPAGAVEAARAGGVLSQANPFVQMNGFVDLSLSRGQVLFIADVQVEDFLTYSLVRGDGAALALVAPGFALGQVAGCCVSLDGDYAAFSVESPTGAFSLEGDAVGVIADPATAVGGSLFARLDQPAAHKGRTVFVASSPARQGVFLHDGGAFTAVADTATPVPGGGGAAFFSFVSPSIHGDAVAFSGCGATGCGVYTTLGGALAKVVAVGDALDGGTVAEVEVGREAISCSSVAFRARFADGAQGVYVADLDGGAPCSNGLDTLTALTVWAGLKNSDDQGTAFDVRAEVRVNGAVVASGETLCVTGLTRDPSRARPIEVSFPSATPVDAGDGDELSLTVLARIGTDGTGARCKGQGASHASAAGLRVYFDSVLRPSAFGVGIGGESARDMYLDGDGAACPARAGKLASARSLRAAATTALAAQCADSPGVVWKAGGNPWREVGTWTTSLPGDGAPAGATPR